MLYELTLFMTYFNQKCINRWNYVRTGTPGSALGSTALLDAFGALPVLGVFPSTGTFVAIKNMVSTSVFFDSIMARALYDVEDFFETPFPLPTNGGAAGEPSSPAVAFGFRTNRVRTDIGRGTKRFVGVSETNIENGGVLTTGGLANAAYLATTMTEPIEYDDSGNIQTFTPVVLQKVQYPVPDTDPVRYAYRYYPTLETQMEHAAVGVTWEAYPNVRTQTSRQYGRGA